MKVISKHDAMQVLARSRLTPVNGRALSVGKFDSGKYAWRGTQNAYIGRDLPDINGVHAVFVERRADADGPYAQLRCVHET